MSLYNIVHGANDTAAILYAVINEVQLLRGFVRQRDAWVEMDGDTVLIRLHTRNGGGNRECWCDVPHDSDCIGWAAESMAEHPWHVRDEDDDFDNTYADFYFAVPADHELAGVLAEHATEHVDVGARWAAAIEAIRSAPTTKER